MRGAEALLEPAEFLGMSVLRKVRVPKPYRNQQLDSKLRRERTKSEAKLLARAKEAGVRVPLIYSISDFELVIGKIDGTLASELKSIPKKALSEFGKALALLHSKDVIHGDFTPANVIIRKDKTIAIIDFGLGFFSNDSEDKAVDVLTMKKALGKADSLKFLAAYAKYGNKSVAVHATEIEKRGRYQERSAP